MTTCRPLARAPVGDGPTLPEAVRLNREYDARLLAADLRALREAPWRGKAAYSSAPNGAQPEPVAWTCLPLHNQGGDPSRTDPGGPGTADFAPTPWLDRAPYLRAAIAGLPGRLRAARLLALQPGASSPVHRDSPCGLSSGWVRLHVPVVTSPGATVTIAGRRLHWPAGTLWYGDFARPHRVDNRGPTTRVHLVVDLAVTAELLDLFPAGLAAAVPSEELLLHREEAPLRDAPRFRCRWRVPDGQALLGTERWTPAPDDPCVVEVEPVGGRLRLTTSDGIEALLVHLGGGRFRYLGWTEMHTLLLLPGRPPLVVWRYREGTRVVEVPCPATQPPP